jgi:hypothetical protein
LGYDSMTDKKSPVTTIVSNSIRKLIVLNSLAKIFSFRLDK